MMTVTMTGVSEKDTTMDKEGENKREGEGDSETGHFTAQNGPFTL